MPKNQITVYLDDEILERLDSDAAALDRSRAWYVNKLIHEHYDRLEAEPAPPQAPLARRPAKRGK